jgi:hypothetical protein
MCGRGSSREQQGERRQETGERGERDRREKEEIFRLRKRAYREMISRGEA